MQTLREVHLTEKIICDVVCFYLLVKISLLFYHSVSNSIKGKGHT